MPCRTRWGSRASLGELLAWDVGLLILVGLLLAGEQALSRGGAPVSARPAGSPQAAPSQPGTPSRAPSPVASAVSTPTQRTSPTPRRRRSGPSRFAREDAGNNEKALTELEGQAQRQLVEGNPDEALALVEAADPILRADKGWRPLRARIRDAVRVRDALVAARIQLEAAADRGDVAQVEALIASLPGAIAREPLQTELALARKRAGDSGDFEVTGFNPGEAVLEGRRAKLSGPVSRAHGQTMLDAVDAVLAHAGRLGLKDLPRPLEVRIQAPDAPRLAPGEARIVSVARVPYDSVRMTERLRWHTARWAVGAELGEASPEWLRRGLVRLLAGSVSVSGGRPQLTPAGEAWRRLFVTQPPLGDGVALLDLLREPNPDPIRAWALTWFTWYGLDPRSAPLQAAMTAGVAGGAASVELTPAEAAELEQAWVDFLEVP